MPSKRQRRQFLYDLAQKIIELRLATRRACMCEGKDQAKKNTLSLKTKVLFLIDKGCSPREIIASLVIAKTNLALLTKEMAAEGLITKTKGTLDRREVCYSLTDNGKKHLNERLFIIEEGVKSGFVTEDDYLEALALLDKAAGIINGLR